MYLYVSACLSVSVYLPVFVSVWPMMTMMMISIYLSI